MQGVFSHMMHAVVYGSIIGVPAASRNLSGAWTIALTGHAAMHSLHRVHPARKATSFTAPGGRWIGNAKRRPMAPLATDGAPGGVLWGFTGAPNALPATRPSR